MFCVSSQSYRSIANMWFQGFHFLRPYVQKPPDCSYQCFCGFLHFHDFGLITSIAFLHCSYFQKKWMGRLGYANLFLDIFVFRSHCTRVPISLNPCVMQVLCFHFIVTGFGYKSHVLIRNHTFCPKHVQLHIFPFFTIFDIYKFCG